MITTTLHTHLIRAPKSMGSYVTQLNRNPSRLIYGLGLIGFYWYALTIFMGPDGHLIALGLLVLTFFGYWIQGIWAQIRNSYLFWLAVIVTFYILLRTLLTCWEFPKTTPHQIEMGLKMAHIAGLPALILVPWLYEENKWSRADWALVLITISFLGNIYLNIDGSEFWAMISLNNSFHINDELRMNPNTAGFLGCIILLGLLIIGVRWLQHIKLAYNKYTFIAACTCWVISSWIIIMTVINSQSRSGWIAFAIVFVISTIALFWGYLIKRNVKSSVQIYILLGLIFGVIFIILAQSNVIINELNQEKKTLKKIFHGNITDLPQHSVGKRISLWKFGIEKVAERPLLGWGPGKFKFVVKEHAPQHIQHLGYPHNGFIQLFFQFGILGVGLIFVIFVLLLHRIIQGMYYKKIPMEWGIYSIGVFIMYFIFSFGDSPFHHEQYRYILVFFFALGYYCNCPTNTYHS